MTMKTLDRSGTWLHERELICGARAGKSDIDKTLGDDKQLKAAQEGVCTLSACSR